MTLSTEHKISDERRILRFPEGFLWGASTSHFQIEGHPLERRTRLSDWSHWTAIAGKIADSTTADVACDFHSRYKSDIEILKSLNLNALRISLNWAVLLPNGNGRKAKKLNSEAVKYYRELLLELKERGIRSFVTLFHFCLPKWLADRGGWQNPETAEAFGQFAELAAESFHDLADFWITVNEPMPYAYQGYVDGSWPPGEKRNYLGAFQCIRNMLVGHAKAYHALRKVDAGAQVSFANHWRPFAPLRLYSPLDHMVSWYRDRVFNHLFPSAVHTGEISFPAPINMRKAVKSIAGPVEGLQGTLDYLGVNYYTRDLSEHDAAAPFDVFGKSAKAAEKETSCMGWESYPDGLYSILTREIIPYQTSHDGKERPIYITENGFATLFPAHLIEGDWSLTDEFRIKYLVSHLMALHKAIKRGANVKGYLYWSLLDNFEWAEGLKYRFGLVRVAFPTQERTLRKSAHVYAKIAEQNAIDLSMTSEMI
ncbi:MAG TPA: family 1 glycosylhydrolase [Candidatus Obscuribacterales bacterium]